MKSAPEYYTLKDINSRKAQYNMIIGQRSNGKTYSILYKILENYANNGKQGVYLRRFDDAIKPSKVGTLFNDIIASGDLKRLFKHNGEWTGVRYYNRCFYLTKTNIRKTKDGEDKEEIITDKKPFLFCMALTEDESLHGMKYPDVTTLFFDEFLTRRYYLPNEFVIFENAISTVKRKRTDLVIYMAGNTINKYCPYFDEMGLNHIRKQQQGTIEVYTYGDSDLKVAVEYCGAVKKNKKSDAYFAFDNPKLKMITGGAWEFDIYPHLPVKYKYEDINYTYFINFDNEIYQCEIISKDQDLFTYIHRKTTPVRKSDDIIFSKNAESSVYKRSRISKPIDRIGKLIWSFFVSEKVFYQDNNVGESIRNYLLWSNGISS